MLLDTGSAADNAITDRELISTLPSASVPNIGAIEIWLTGGVVSVRMLNATGVSTLPIASRLEATTVCDPSAKIKGALNVARPEPSTEKRVSEIPDRSSAAEKLTRVW